MRNSTKDIFNSQPQQYRNTMNYLTYHNSSYPNNENSFNKQNNPEKIFEKEEIYFLINNAKNLEKVLTDNNPLEKIDDLEKKLQENVIKIEGLQNSTSEIIHNKMEIEIKIKELKGLINQYNDRFNKIDKFLGDNSKNTNIKPNNEINDNFNTNNFSENKIKKNFSKIKYKENLKNKNDLDNNIKKDKKIIEEKNKKTSQSFKKKKNENTFIEENHFNTTLPEKKIKEKLKVLKENKNVKEKTDSSENIFDKNQLIFQSEENEEEVKLSRFENNTNGNLNKFIFQPNNETNKKKNLNHKDFTEQNNNYNLQEKNILNKKEKNNLNNLNKFHSNNNNNDGNLKSSDLEQDKIININNYPTNKINEYKFSEIQEFNNLNNNPNENPVNKIESNMKHPSEIKNLNKSIRNLKVNNNYDLNNSRNKVNNINSKTMTNYNSKEDLLCYNSDIEEKKNLEDKIFTNKNNVINLENSKIINLLFSQEKVPEAIEQWRKYNYLKFDGMSYERSYEMMAQITKIKDRDIEKLLKKIENFNQIKNENSKKNIDIIELIAEIESMKYKISDLENEVGKNKILENKFNKISLENSLLYKENIKLKAILDQERYFNNK